MTATNNVPQTKTKVLADGTYATETVYSSSTAAKLEAVKSASKPPLRSLILGGDFYTAAVLCSTLTKLILRYADLSQDERVNNELRAEVRLCAQNGTSPAPSTHAQGMLIMTSIIRVGQSPFSSAPIDEDSVERIMTCLQSLATASAPRSSPQDADPLRQIFLHDTQAAYTGMVQHGEEKAKEKKAKESKSSAIQADDLITFRQFAKKAGGDADEVRRSSIARARLRT